MARKKQIRIRSLDSLYEQVHSLHRTRSYVELNCDQYTRILKTIERDLNRHIIPEDHPIIHDFSEVKAAYQRGMNGHKSTSKNLARNYRLNFRKG